MRIPALLIGSFLLAGAFGADAPGDAAAAPAAAAPAPAAAPAAAAEPAAAAPAAAPAPAAPAASSITIGSFTLADDKKSITVTEKGTALKLAITDSTTVTIAGKPGTLDALKAKSPVTVTYSGTNALTIDQAKKGKKKKDA